MKYFIVLGVFVSFHLFAATERVIYSGSRSDQQVYLEEDYYQNVTYTQQIPVTRNVCTDVPVTQNYCEWVPGQRVCQTRPICHPTPYGPRCVPTYGCYDTPARQWCRPVTTVQRQCGPQTVYEQVTRTERRFMYRSVANLTFSFGEIPREYSYIEFDVNLINDQISLLSNDFNGPIIFAKLTSQNQGRRGYYQRSYEISSISRERFLAPVSQIPDLITYQNGFTQLQIGQTEKASDIKTIITLRHLRTGYSTQFVLRSGELEMKSNHSILQFSLPSELGRNWNYWRGNIAEMHIKIIRVSADEILNTDFDERSFTENRFFF